MRHGCCWRGASWTPAAIPPRPLLLAPCCTLPPRDVRAQAWRDIATWLLFALAALRGVLLLAHDPLLALANNYDQVRYTACLGLYPTAPGVPPQQQNYRRHCAPTPSRHRRTQSAYWTSDLLFRNAAAAVPAGRRSRRRRCIRCAALAALRLNGLAAGSPLLLQRAWRHDGRNDLALAHAACTWPC